MAAEAQQLDFSSVGAIPETPPKKDAIPKQGGKLDFSSLGAVPAQQSDPADDNADVSGVSMADLSEKNPKNAGEGLYHMKDADGHSYAIPYSNVHSVDDWENRFVDNKELERYKQDHREETSPVSITKIRHNISKETADVKKNGGFAHDYLLRPAVNTANAAARTVVEPVVDYVDNSGASREEKEKRGQAEWENSVFGRAESDTREHIPVKELAKDAAQVGGDIVPIMPVGTMGRQMAHDATHGHKMDVVTDLAGMGLIAGISHGMAKALPAEVPGRGSLTEAARRAVGTDIRATEDLVRETKTKNAKADLAYKEASPEQKAAIDDVRKENEAAKAEHDKKVAEIRKGNEEEQAAFEKARKKRTNLVAEKVKRSETLRKLQTRVHQHIQGIRDAGADWFNGQYNSLAKQTSGARTDLSPLTESVEKEKLETLADPITKVPIFDDIIRKSKGEVGEGKDVRPPADWDEMSHEDRKAWRDEQLEGSGATYRYLLGKYRQIGKLMSSPGLDPTVRQGLANVRTVIERMQTEVAKIADEKAPERHAADLAEWERDVAERGEKKAGPKPQMPSQKASQINYSIGNKYRNFAESYRDPGSIGAKIADADTPTKGTDPLLKDLSDDDLSNAKRTLVGKEEAGGKATNATQWAGRNAAEDSAGKRLTRTQKRQQTIRLIDKLRKAHAEYESVPDVGGAPTPPTPKPEPEFKPTPEPEFPPPKGETISPERLKLEKQTAIDDYFKKLRKNRIRVGVAGVGTIGLAEFISHFVGLGGAGTYAAGGALMGITTFGPTIMMKMLKMPGVVDSLMKITRAETEAIEGMAPAERASVDKNIISMTQVAKAKGIIKPTDPTPMAKWAKADLAKAKVMAETEKVVEPAEPERGAVEVKLPTVEEVPAEAQPESRSHVVAGDIVKDIPTELFHGTTSGNESAIEQNGLHPSPREAEGKTPGYTDPRLYLTTDEGYAATYGSPHYKVTLPEGAVLRRGADGYYTDTHIPAENIEKRSKPGSRDVVGSDGMTDNERYFVENRPPHLTKEQALARVREHDAAVEKATSGHHQPSRRLEDLKVDPKRFQYKLGGNKHGVTDSLSDAKWDQDLADPIHIWEDPEDGEEYVVNGHHRVDMAQKAGAEHINTSSIDNTKVKTASEAREFGAMKNIADGNGTAVDAAKFFREKGLGPEDLRKRGLSLKKSVANEGVALARLSDDIFDRVVDGKIDSKIGAAIGEATDVASDQEAIMKDVARKEKAGIKVTPDQIRESARLVKSAPSFNETTHDLFGEHNETRNLFMEMGEVSDYIQKQLASEKRIFGSVSDKARGDKLAAGGNVIKPEENAKIAQQAAQQREIYQKLSARSGPINSTLHEAARRIADGEDSSKVKADAFDEIREELAQWPVLNAATDYVESKKKDEKRAYELLKKRLGDIADSPDFKNLPEFIKRGVDLSKVTRDMTPNEQARYLAYVSALSPHTIRVAHPEAYSQDDETHEMTHVYQYTRDAGMFGTGKVPNYFMKPWRWGTPDSKDYDYGGEAGLEKAAADGKKMKDFNIEQQADIVADYQRFQRDMLYRAERGMLSQKALDRAEKTIEAYHPFVQQLADMAGETGGGYDINARPSAPGLPSVNTPGLGVFTADPLMIDKRVRILTPEQYFDVIKSRMKASRARHQRDGK